MIISSNDATPNVKKDLEKLKKLIEENHIFVGLSNCFENLFESHKYYVEALKALNYGKSTGNQRISLFSQIPADLP